MATAARRAAVVARVVHDLPRRLRLKAAGLIGPDTDASFLAEYIQAVPGVVSVRVNTGAQSLVVGHDGRPGLRGAVLAQLATLDRRAVQRLDGDDKDIGPPVRVMTAMAALLARPFLPPPARAAVTWLAIAPALTAGARTLLAEGIRVEVLDAVALGAAAAKGDYTTALATQSLLALGERLEESANRRSNDLLKRLLRPGPARAWVEKDGVLAEVDAAAIAADNVVVVGPGDMVPVDGQIVSGSALVNESAISGEFIPADRHAGERVHSGTVVDQGRLRIRAVVVGGDTTAARIGRFLRESLNQPAHIQRSAEKLANRRVMLTLGLGALTWLLTRDVSRVASVFLVDYSCAVKLGTPVAIKAAMHRGAHRGILIKGGQAIEKLAEADTVVFDKTGTLTYGQLDVTDVVSLEPRTWPHGRLLALIASIEEHATHPVAEAVVSAARQQHLAHVNHEDVEFIVAHGMISEIEEGRVVIGSRHFLEEHEAVSFAGRDRRIAALEADGKNLLFVSVSGRLTGIVALRDTLRGEAAETLRRLRRQGVRSLVMITGDRTAKAHALGADLGIDEAFAEQPPERKAEIVQALQAQGRKVAFVGDGVNDAPALMAAHVGIAMPNGADLARATADIVLTEDRLDAVAEAHDIAGTTMALIRSNFRLAVGVNSALFVAASMGWVPPILSALLHNGTTIGVLLRGMSGATARPPRLPPPVEKHAVTALPRAAE